MATTHTGALTGHDYAIPELIDKANVVTAFTQFADTIRAYPTTRIITQSITGDVTGEAQMAYIYSGNDSITVTLPDNPFDGDRVIAYQLGDGQVLMSSVDSVLGGVPSTGAKFGAVTSIYSETDGGWYHLPFPL
jgi:hypothetical protein